MQVISIEQLYEIYLKHRVISTDTRHLPANCLFFALKGKNFNGNAFAKDALLKGAAFVVIDQAEFCPESPWAERTLLVADVLESLQKLANFHRKKQNIPFIGLTGSNGKTTSKELLKTVLAKKYKVYATEGNLNNHIGVPLTLLRLPKEAEIAVIEMGANKVGDIAQLCDIAEPTHGFITNIGYAHIEGFGSYEGVLRGKTELYQFLRSHNGTVFIHSQDEVLSNMAKRFENPILYGTKNDYAFLTLEKVSPFIVYRDEEDQQVQTQLIGSYNFPNLAIAWAIGKYFGVSQKQANEALASYIPDNNRSQIIEKTKQQNKIILDAYNANPSSVAAALQNFDSIESNLPKIAILGDMYELGNIAQSEHRKIIDLAKSLKIDLILLCGKHYGEALSPSESVLHFEMKNDLVQYLQQKTIAQSLVLIKASRGLGLETLVESL
ncbi:UDP-N-acetylmuramoyl-tripeptide--D-alanyl-D-alanine ligase [Hugenholtzia roseola]|uniref:UDP-N-acetylmuramoyl-tripeptide--D-alanyl-D- alanine ligase n=1 Tax=Hugenholtzia roseola TaxID=1002 RepID=UPI00316ACC5B